MENTVIQNTYTNRDYWEKYYERTNIDAERIKRVVSAYDYYWDLLIKSAGHKPETIIEIGAFPGRYLAYLSAKYNLKPTSLDYNSATGKIESCFKAFGLSEYECIQADFITHKTEKKYDLVMSNGFIEHFENYDEILDKHCQYLSPGGAMYLMIPNKRYLRKWYSYLVDKDNLKIHNLKTMRLEVFRQFAKRNNLEIKLLTYHGGFSFSVHQKLNPLQNFIFRSFRSIFRYLNPYVVKHPNKYLSSSIIAIFSKK